MSALQEILDAIENIVTECLDPCDYLVTTTMGMPPAECNLISVFPIRSDRRDDSNRANTLRDESVGVHIMRCCDAVDAQLNWASQQEAKEMKCLVRDVDALDVCFECKLADALTGLTVCPKDNANVEAIQWDDVRRGGCYGVTFIIDYVRKVCCPTV